MMLSYQEQKKLEEEKAPLAQYNLATVTAADASGVSIKFDGEESPRQKKYPYNASVSFQTGQRVRVEKINGQYVVAYPIAGGGNTR